jgi:hypothetical protein
MKTLSPEKPAWQAATLRIIFLVIIVLLLLPFLSPVQSACPSGCPPPTSLPGASGVKSGNHTPPGLRSAALDRENPGRHLACLPVASFPAPGINQNVTVRLAILGRLPWRCPLAPASAFHLQTNLRKYLETCPTPGSTVSEAWPEYVPEDGEDVD